MPAEETRNEALVSRVHHVAVIATDYMRSKDFYSRVLGLEIIAETYRAERDSYKLDLRLADGAAIELFSLPIAPPRPTKPEASGLRHLAFAVDDLDLVVERLAERAISVEPVRVDEVTGARFTFADPDGLPLELYEVRPPPFTG